MEETNEEFEFRALEHASLDGQITRILNALAAIANTRRIEDVQTLFENARALILREEALTLSDEFKTLPLDEQAAENPVLLLAYFLGAAGTSPKFCYFEVVIQLALEAGGNLEVFLRAIDHHLIALFRSTDPDIPRDVEILTFLMHYAVHGPVWHITGGVTLLDAYLDLTVADLQQFNAEEHGAYFAHSIPDTVTTYCAMDDEAFHAEKWRLLNSVLSLKGNTVCNAPGVRIVDNILSSLDGPADAIRGTKSNFGNYFPENINKPPTAIQQLIDFLADNPICADQFQAPLLNDLNIFHEDDSALIVNTLSRLEDVIFEKYNEAVTSFKAHITTELVEVDETYINDCTVACEAYLFTDAVMEVLNIFYPHYGINGIAHWFMNSPACDWFLDALNNPIETEIKKKKKITIQSDYITAQRIIDSGEACYPVVYLLTKIGRSGSRIRTLNGQSKGIAREREEDRQGILAERLIGTAGFRVPRAKKVVNVATNEASCILDILMRTYRFQALNHLMYREVHFLDPIIGDTLCELRPAFLMDCDIIIQGVLPNHQNWQDLIRAYNTSRRGCPLDEHLITGPLDIIGEVEPYEYVLLCQALETELQAQGASYFPRFLTLCKAMTRAAMLVRDPLGTEMGEYDTGIMDRHQRQPRRMELGTYNIWYTKSRVNMLGDITINNARLSQRCQLLDDTAQLLNNCYALHQDGEIPVVPLYQAQLFTMLKAYVLNRPIIVRLKRIHITSQREDLTFNTGKGNTETLDNFDYQIVGSEVLVFQPNHQTGSFDFVANPADDLLDMPCMTISAYGLLDLTDPNSWANDPGCHSGLVDGGYYSDNAQDYIDFIKSQNIVNLLNVCSANHPPFPKSPKVIGESQRTSEDGLLGQFQAIDSCGAERQFWIDLTTVRSNNHAMGDQFTYLTELYGQELDDLGGVPSIVFGDPYTLYQYGAFEDFAEFYRLGEATDLGARQFKERTLTTYDDNGQHTVYKRRRGNMPFYSTHIYCSTLRVERLRNRNDGNGFYRTDPVDSFEDKDVVVDFTIAYLLQELNDAQSTQPEQPEQDD